MLGTPFSYLQVYHLVSKCPRTSNQQSTAMSINESSSPPLPIRIHNLPLQIPIIIPNLTYIFHFSLFSKLTLTFISLCSFNYRSSTCLPPSIYCARETKIFGHRLSHRPSLSHRSRQSCSSTVKAMQKHIVQQFFLFSPL